MQIHWLCVESVFLCENGRCRYVVLFFTRCTPWASALKFLIQWQSFKIDFSTFSISILLQSHVWGTVVSSATGASSFSKPTLKHGLFCCTLKCCAYSTGYIVSHSLSSWNKTRHVVEAFIQIAAKPPLSVDSKSNKTPGVLMAAFLI